MSRYYFAAFLLCMVGLVVAFVFGRHLSALLFTLGTLCFAVRVLWEMRRPAPAGGIEHLDIAGGEHLIDTWSIEMDNARRKMANALNQPLNLSEYGPLLILPPGATLEGAQRSYPQLRKREAFRRYREHWAGVGQ